MSQLAGTRGLPAQFSGDFTLNLRESSNVLCRHYFTLALFSNVSLQSLVDRGLGGEPAFEPWTPRFIVLVRLGQLR